MTQPPPPTGQPDAAPPRSFFQRIGGPRIPERLKAWARAVPILLGEYWLLTLFGTLLLGIWFVGFAEGKASDGHWEYWWSVLTGNYQPAAGTLRTERFYPYEYGTSLVIALMINITPLVGVILFIPRYVRMLVQQQEQPVKLQALLELVEGLARSELLTEFGQSEENMDKIKSAFSRVDSKRPGYVAKVFGEKAGSDFDRLLNKELTG
ncbi:hypothetical protein [Bradyrhizobium sp. USDA 4520]